MQVAITTTWSFVMNTYGVAAKFKFNSLLQPSTNVCIYAIGMYSVYALSPDYLY